MDLLDTQDINSLKPSELEQLCCRLRELIIEQVSAGGGHLASNLGVVELTVALHKVYDTAKDRLIFDVGHQCYAHKLLTGRRDRFGTLRGYGGISGFPKPSESVHDAAIAGHASTSISTALGMVRARALLGGNYHVAAVIGDGSLTGGMAFEALADAGHSGLPMVVILNDTEMSIDKSVGGIARYLARLRVRQGYFKVKTNYHRIVRKLPGGHGVDKLLHTVKTGVKEAFFDSSLFESMGFMYLGPVDGHDISTLTRVLLHARDSGRPALVHVCTVKGKGCDFAERNPAAYHGVAGFDVKTGTLAENGDSFSTEMGRMVIELAAKNPTICAVTAAMGDATGLEPFRGMYPERFYDVGIAEQHAVTMAAGMAKQGLRPLCAIYSTFLQRAFDQMFHDVALDKLPVVFAVDRSGLTGQDGETHHGLFDASYLCMIPGMTVLSPASFAELRHAIYQAFGQHGPVAVRYPKGGEGLFKGCCTQPAIVRDGKDVTLLTYGVTVNQALEAAGLLDCCGVSARVVKLFAINPIDVDRIAPLLTSKILAVEESCQNGGVSERVIAALSVRQAGYRTAMLTAGHGVVTHGGVERLRGLLGLDARGIAKAALELCEVRNNG